jgi:ribulose 1,5-bisphosphate synthetase/thiazole synthase
MGLPNFAAISVFIMEEPTFFDFLIVGAGIAGSTLALELNSLGQKIAVIDLRIVELLVCSHSTI